MALRDISAPTLKIIGTIRTGYQSLKECPTAAHKNPDLCQIDLKPEFADGLLDIEEVSHILLLYWFDQSDRSVLQSQGAHHDRPHGVFATGSPQRPNPIAASVVKLINIDGTRLTISGLDCLDGTALLDIKPYVPSLDRAIDARFSFGEQVEDSQNQK